MKEDLIGFVTGALDAQEQLRLEELVRQDAELQSQVAAIRRCLQPLESYRHCEPPAGLSNQTLAYVFEQVDQHKVQSATTIAQPAFSAKPEVTASRRLWRPMDIFMTGVVTASLLMLLSPALFNSRFTADLRQCQNNLQDLYNGFARYSITNHGQFPTVSGNSPLSTSGAYAPILLDLQFVTDEGSFFCPSAEESTGWRQLGIPTRQMVVDAGAEQIDALRQRMGGTYGYSVGHQSGGQIQGIRNQQRPYFALIADRPQGQAINRRSSNHGGLGQNILFEDGHVAFVRETQHVSRGDRYFVSDRGIVEPGRHRDDSVILESGLPLVNLD